MGKNRRFQFGLHPLSLRKIRGWGCAIVLIFMVFVMSATGMLPLRAKMPDSGNNIGETCNAAAQFAANVTGVPVAVLRAISLTETGRLINGVFTPWPWTVNVGGQGKWFSGRKSAHKFAQSVYKRGARSFDIGCFQLNYKWHGKNFLSIDQMFDPRTNAVYAARYLRNLFQTKGDWVAAAGAYHSNTPKYARKYSRRFSRIWADIAPVATGRAPRQPPAPGKRTARGNTYPFFIASGAQGAFGSLVALAQPPSIRRLVVPAGRPLF